MALQMDIAFEAVGVTVSAYVRIEEVRNNRFEDGMACVARCYKDDPGFPPTREAFKDIFFSVPYNPSAGDAYAQAYAGAKLLPEFAGAVDVLEAARAPAAETPPAALVAEDDPAAAALRAAAIPRGSLG